MRQEQQQKPLKLKKQEMKFKDTQTGKGQVKPCDPYQRLQKVREENRKVKVEALTTHFYSFPLLVFTTALKM